MAQHNTPKRNLEFEITWNETNLLWLLGGSPSKETEEKIAATRDRIKMLKTELKEISL